MQQISGEDIHRGALPRAVRSEEPDDLAFLDGEGDAVERRFVAVTFDQIFNAYHIVAFLTVYFPPGAGQSKSK